MTDETPTAPADTLRQRIADAVDDAWRKSLETHAFGPRARAEITYAVLAVVQPELDRLRKAERAVNLLAGSHRRAEDATAAIARARELHRPANDWSWKPLGCQHDGAHNAPCRGCRGECWPCPTIQALDGQPPAPDAGPTVREAADHDRQWPLQKHGE